MQLINFELRGDYIALDALLKATGLAASGGAAKTAVIAGHVQVDGRVELRRSRKVHAGAVVGVPGARVSVRAAGEITRAMLAPAGEPGAPAAAADPASPAVMT